MKDEYKKIADAIRFCAGSKEPCSKCPYFGELDPFDCQSQVMYKAAELLEQLTEAGT